MIKLLVLPLHSFDPWYMGFSCSRSSSSIKENPAANRNWLCVRTPAESHPLAPSAALTISVCCVVIPKFMLFQVLFGSAVTLVGFFFSSLQLSDTPGSSHGPNIPADQHMATTQAKRSCNTMAPPRLCSVRVTDGSCDGKPSSEQQSNWISGIITCLRPEIGRASCRERV